MIKSILKRNYWHYQILMILIVISSLAAGCFKGDDSEPVSPAEQLEMDIKAIDAYLQANQISASSHESGLRYMIKTEGNEVRATIVDSILVNYEGRFMHNGQVFDADESVAFSLGDLIQGWQIGIRLIGEGGSIVLYIPSGFAYGPFGVAGAIPPNANVIFDIDLLDVIL